ncbi:MAG TPA: ABC transporter ATP-binding protein [Chthoniobacteraceae bacterium]|nr:ABC transporter ATP-binding protein [Chthoniobacteraceae bacterium]
MALIELRNVSKTYHAPDGGDAVDVLRGVDLTIDAGETVAFVGPSGSGKSTALNVIGALDCADAGEVIVDGREVGKLGEEELAAYRNTTVGFIFQLHHLLPQCTILENVLIPTLAAASGDRKARHARAESLLESVGLKHRLNHRPGELSGGERQRVAVARALINEPKVLLADEPTGEVDSETEERLLAIFDEHRNNGGASLIVSHSDAIARRADRIIHLQDGKVVSG